MKLLTTEERHEHNKLISRKFDWTNEHALLYNTSPNDMFEFATNRIYANVGEAFSLDGIKFVVKNAQTTVLKTPYGNRDFTPYQDEIPNNFVLNEFIKNADIIRYYKGKMYKSLKYISQAFKTPDIHTEYWEEIIEESI